MSASAEAFRQYDFDSDVNWRSYRANLEIPAGRDVDATLEKFKAKWYQREVDGAFDPSVVNPAPGPNAPRTAETASTFEAGPRPQRSQQTSPQPAQRAASGISSLFNFSPQALLFGLHSATLVLAILHLQPLNRKWSHYAWLYFLQTTMLCSAYKLYLKYGLPKLRPFPSAIKQWAVPATSGTDFHYAMLALLFLGSKPITLVLVPISVVATYHWFAFVRQQERIRGTAVWQRYGEPAHAWLVARQGLALQYNAVAEIGIGFVSLLSLLSPPRNFLVPFLVFNFLRMRYWSPDAATFHRQAWTLLDQRTQTILQYLPILQMPIGWVQKWFLKVPGQ